jgi:hypothetical protein
MHKFIARVAVGVLLALIALQPVTPGMGQTFQLPPVCQQLAFSTEEDFVTQGPEPPDGNPILSDGDLLGIGLDDSGAIRCTVCARNADLLAQTFDVSVDIGLDAVDVLDAEAYLVAFPTELNSPNVGQFTAGDLLITNGTIIPNQALTAKWQVGYDLGLDAVHLVGTVDRIKAFLAEAAKHSRDEWLTDLGLLARLLAQYGIDIWFSTEGPLGPVDDPVFLDGDLLSAATGTIVAGNDVLLPPGVPAGIPVRGVDFGLDAVTANRAGSKELIGYSTEILHDGQVSFDDGDILRLGNGVTASHEDLIKCFAPKANFLGLDALYARVPDVTTPAQVYLPIVFRDHR